MHYKYNGAKMASATDKVDQMVGLQGVVDGVDGVSAFPFAFSHLFYEQYQVIDEEMYTNLGLAMAAVLVITLVLIGHPTTSLLVFACVAMTLVDVLGMMWVWGIAIDSVAVINLTLAVGLAVDYAAHIGHSFMLCSGTIDERIVQTMADMGTSVFNGGSAEPSGRASSANNCGCLTAPPPSRARRRLLHLPRGGRARDLQVLRLPRLLQDVLRHLALRHGARSAPSRGG
jgi:hypothetical protein